jgi:8-oxo-dGTP diphosphatase
VASKRADPRVTQVGEHGDATVLAAGGVVWRGEPETPGEERDIAVVHRPKYDDWSLPKGKADAGEQLVVTARREVHEETGSIAVCGQVAGEQRYRVAAGAKYVRYWAMKQTAGDFTPQEEVDELLWLPLRRAARKLTYTHDRQLVDGFAQAAACTATVLLVRHGKAGKKEEWKGDDALRPLDAEGAEQARRLGAVALCYAPVRIASANLVRCADSVRGVSLATGVALDIEPQLGRDAYAKDPQATLDWVREQIAAGGTSLLCSQGEVIPDLISRLAGGSTAKLRHPPSRKGSVWALSFAGDRLIAADYDADLMPAVPTEAG